jgi:cell division protein FtsL
MPKGGPLAFLNKKHWHPGRLQNQEKVWKKEQEAAKEQQKLEDLRKQIEEERAKEELNAMAAAAGVKVYVHRIWTLLCDPIVHF